MSRRARRRALGSRTGAAPSARLLAPALVGAALLLPLLLQQPPAQAQRALTQTEFVPTFSTNARVKQQLDRLAKLSSQKLWDEWLNTYQELVDDPRDLVFAKDEEFLGGVRSHCHQMLAALPANVRQRYRTLRDADARRLYDKALADRDAAGMREVYERYRFTSAGALALQWMAAHALDDGKPEMARLAFSRLAKDAAVSAPMLLRYALAADAAGKPQEAKAALDRVRKEFGALPMDIGGQKSTGAAAADQIAKSLQAAPTKATGGWRSFAGPGNTRQMSRSVSGGVKKLWEFAYPTSVGRSGGGFNGTVLVGSNRQRFTFLTFPNVTEDRVFVQCPRNVNALDLSNGKALWDQPSWTQTPEETPKNADVGVGFRGGNYGRPTLRAVQASATLDGRLLITRMPLQTTDQTWPVDFAIVAMDAKTGKQIWRRVAGGDTKSVFYNAPVVQGNVIYTGMATYKGGITEFSATALDASTGETLWTTYLGAGSDPFQGTDGSPVAIRDGLVWIESPLYSLSALDVLTGEIRVIYHYTPERRSSYRSFDYGVSVVNEPISLIAGGTGPVVFAPRWGVDVIALDPESGKLLWSSPKGPAGTTIGSIFGADDKRVYVCGDYYLQALSLADGARDWEWPSQESLGYAALCGDRIYVPSQGKVLVHSAGDGAEVEVLDTSAAVGDGSGLCSVVATDKLLLVGTAEKLIAFGPP